MSHRGDVGMDMNLCTCPHVCSSRVQGMDSSRTTRPFTAAASFCSSGRKTGITSQLTAHPFLPVPLFPFWLLHGAYFWEPKEATCSCSLFCSQRKESASEFPSVPLTAKTKALPSGSLSAVLECARHSHSQLHAPALRALLHLVAMSCAWFSTSASDFGY